VNPSAPSIASDTAVDAGRDEVVDVEAPGDGDWGSSRLAGMLDPILLEPAADLVGSVPCSI
jgi:hypothetical protein